MRKLINKLNFAIIGIMTSLSAMAAAPATTAEGAGKVKVLGADVSGTICELAGKLNGVFKTFQILAFVGAGITLAKWGYDLVTKGDGWKTDDAQKKLISMLAGTIILFSIGTLLTVFMSMTGDGGSFECATNFFKN